MYGKSQWGIILESLTEPFYLLFLLATAVARIIGIISFNGDPNL